MLRSTCPNDEAAASDAPFDFRASAPRNFRGDALDALIHLCQLAGRLYFKRRVEVPPRVRSFLSHVRAGLYQCLLGQNLQARPRFLLKPFRRPADGFRRRMRSANSRGIQFFAPSRKGPFPGLLEIVAKARECGSRLPRGFPLAIF